MSFGHVPRCCFTSFTNNLEYVTAFSNLNSLYRLYLNLPKGVINKTCSHICGLYLVANIGQVQTNLLVSFCLLKGDLKDGIERRFVLPPLSLRLQHTYYGATMHLSVLLLWDYLINLALIATYSEDTRAMLPHCPGDFITGVEQFFSMTITFKGISLSV